MDSSCRSAERSKPLAWPIAPQAIILFVLVILPLLIHVVRVWWHFWVLLTWAVFLLLLFNSLLGALVSLVFLLLFGR